MKIVFFWGGTRESQGQVHRPERVNQDTCPYDPCVKCSQNGGRSWVTRCSNASYGTFRDLLVYGNELLACTSKGVYVSTNDGRSFAPRCTNNSYGEFLNLQESGSELLANTTKGLYYSRNGGRSWVRR